MLRRKMSEEKIKVLEEKVAELSSFNDKIKESSLKAIALLSMRISVLETALLEKKAISEQDFENATEKVKNQFEQIFKELNG